MLDNNRTEISLRKIKYDSKYFGIATGVLAAILFLLIILNSVISDINATQLLKPLIPFWNGISFTYIVAGFFASFIWGWLIGFFFILIYNWFDKRFTK